MENKETIKIKKILEKEQIEEILNRKVSKYGSSGKVGIPKKHIGKETIVLVKKSVPENKIIN